MSFTVKDFKGWLNESAGRRWEISIMPFLTDRCLFFFTSPKNGKGQYIRITATGEFSCGEYEKPKNCPVYSSERSVRLSRQFAFQTEALHRVMSFLPELRECLNDIPQIETNY